MLLHTYKVIFKVQTEVLKNKEALNADEERIMTDDSTVSKMETFMDQFLSTFQSVNFDIIVNLPLIATRKN